MTDRRDHLDFTHDWILEVDSAGRIVWANRPAEAALARELGDLIDRNVLDLISLDSREEWEMCLDTVTRGVPVEGANLTLRTGRGETLRVEARIIQLISSPQWNPLREGAGTLGVYFRSLTEEQEVRQALRQSEEQLRTVMSSLPDVLIVFDALGRYRQIYTANHELLVGPPEHLLGQSLSDFLPETEAENHRTVIQQVTTTRVPADYEYSLNLSRGTCWFSARIVPFGSDRDPRVLWVARDTTDLQQARQRLREDEQLLRNLLQLETKAREVIAYEIHDGFIQHAIGTQMWLQAVKSMEGIPPRAQKGIHAAWEAVQQGIQDARSMLGDLRPRLAEGQGIAAGLRQLVHGMQERTSIRLELACDGPFPDLLPLLESQLFRMTQEALNNVIRHSRAQTARVALDHAEEQITLMIEDDGVGFDIVSVGDDRYGLEGIRQRASAFGGTAVIRSQPSNGTQIEVTLPLLLPLASESPGPLSVERTDVRK